MTAHVSPAHYLSHFDANWQASLTPAEAAVLPWTYGLWLRPEQHLPAHQWRTCGMSGGRGWGKSLTASVEINGRVERGEEKHVLLMAPTEERVELAQIRPLIEAAPPWFKPERYRGGLRWPNGVRALTFTPEAPGRTRGENATLSWCSELVDWKHGTRSEAWDNLATATRSPNAFGREPQIIWDSTSKGRNDLLSKLHAACDADPVTHVRIEGQIFDNQLLTLQYLRAEWERYSGVRREEELFGRRFNESSGASFRQAWLDRTRVTEAPEFESQIVSVDPAQSQNEGSDETGIVRLARARDGHVYVVADETGKYSPEDWADRAVRGADPRNGGGGRVSVERNHLGDAAASLIRSRATNASLQVRVLGKDEPWPPFDKRCIFIREQWARESKGTRAEGPAAETEAGRVHLVGDFPELETELTTFVPDSGVRSPNRFDAFVYGVIELRELRTDAKPDRREDVAVATVAQAKLTEMIRGHRPQPAASGGRRQRTGL